MEDQQALKLDKDSPEAKIYSRIKIQISLISLIVNFAILLVFSFSGLSRAIVNYIDFYFYNPYIQFGFFAFVMGSVFFVIGMLFDWYGGYIVEHEFKLSKQSFSQWLFESIKSTLVGLAIAVPLLFIFFFLIRLLGNNWWWVFALILLSLSVLMARLAPILIFPLFYKFTPITEGEIYDRIKALLEKEKIAFSGIYSFNMSKNTRKANAGFTGMGKTKRIILSDTLIEQFTPEEIEVIFAHELGHFRKKHIIKNVIIGSVTIFASFYICNLIYSNTLQIMGFVRTQDIAALPVLLLYLSIFSFMIMPVTNAFSRTFEREADRYAIKSTANKKAFISAMQKLAAANLADSDPHPMIEFLLYSHPSIRKRIEAAEK